MTTDTLFLADCPIARERAPRLFPIAVGRRSGHRIPDISVVRSVAEAAMEFRILGLLEARSDDLPLPLGGPRQRALLAYLLLHANEVVSAERLLDELWYDLPLGGAAAIQTQISRLRKVVGERLVSSGQGYALHVGPDELDLHRLRALLAEAGEAQSPDERSLLLREAEALWSGDPLAGLD